MEILLYHKYEVNPFNVVMPVALWHVSTYVCINPETFCIYTICCIYPDHILCCCFTAGGMCFLYHISVLGMHGLSWYMLYDSVGTHSFMAVWSRGNEGITAAHMASTRALTAETLSGWTTVPTSKITTEAWGPNRGQADQVWEWLRRVLKSSKEQVARPEAHRV